MSNIKRKIYFHLDFLCFSPATIVLDTLELDGKLVISIATMISECCSIRNTVILFYTKGIIFMKVQSYRTMYQYEKDYDTLHIITFLNKQTKRKPKNIRPNNKLSITYLYLILKKMVSIQETKHQYMKLIGKTVQYIEKIITYYSMWAVKGDFYSLHTSCSDTHS